MSRGIVDAIILFAGDGENNLGVAIAVSGASKAWLLDTLS